jgi:hypothetical protein
MFHNKFKILMAPENDTGGGGGEQASAEQQQQQQQQAAPAVQAAPPFDMNAFLGQLKQEVQGIVAQTVDARLGQQRQSQGNGDDELMVDDDTQKFVGRVVQQTLAPIVQTQRALADNQDTDKFSRLCQEIGATAEEVKVIEEKYQLYAQHGLAFTNSKGQKAAMSRLDAADMVLGGLNIDRRRKEGADRMRQRGNAHASMDTGGRDSAPDLPRDLDTLPLSEQNKKLASVLDKDGF